MKARTIRDCERDVKGLHEFEIVGENTGGFVYWCRKCGAIAEETEPKSGGLNKFTVTDRVQE